MTGEGLPELPTRPTVIELTAYNAPRSCTVCGEPADYYAFLTKEEVKRRLDASVDLEKAPVNAMLCKEHFAEAPRVSSVEELVGAA